MPKQGLKPNAKVGNGGGSKVQLTPEDILAWADGLSGIPGKESAAKQEVSKTTILARRTKVANFIGEKFDIDQYRMPMYGLYSLAVNSVAHNLRKNDVTMTIAYMKGLNIFSDQIGLNINDVTRATNAELHAEYEQLCPVTDVTSKSDTPGRDSSRTKTA